MIKKWPVNKTSEMTTEKIISDYNQIYLLKYLNQYFPMTMGTLWLEKKKEQPEQLYER